MTTRSALGTKLAQKTFKFDIDVMSFATYRSVCSEHTWNHISTCYCLVTDRRALRSSTSKQSTTSINFFVRSEVLMRYCKNVLTSVSTPVSPQRQVLKGFHVMWDVMWPCDSIFKAQLLIDLTCQRWHLLWTVCSELDIVYNKILLHSY